ncbi:unnamed protein product, partial [Amoebophrya sp. A120]
VQPKFDYCRFPRSEFCYLCRRHRSVVTEPLRRRGDHFGSRVPTCQDCEARRQELLVIAAPTTSGAEGSAGASSSASSKSGSVNIADGDTTTTSSWFVGSNEFLRKNKKPMSKRKKKTTQKILTEDSGAGGGALDNSYSTSTRKPKVALCQQERDSAEVLWDVRERQKNSTANNDSDARGMEFAPASANCTSESQLSAVVKMVAENPPSVPACATESEPSPCASDIDATSQGSTAAPEIVDYNEVSKHVPVVDMPFLTADFCVQVRVERQLRAEILDLLNYTAPAYNSEQRSEEQPVPRILNSGSDFQGELCAAKKKSSEAPQSPPSLRYSEFSDMEEDPSTALFCRDTLSRSDRLLMYGEAFETDTDFADAVEAWPLTKAKKDLVLCREALFRLRDLHKKASGGRKDASWWTVLREKLANVQSTEDLWHCFEIINMPGSDDGNYSHEVGSDDAKGAADSKAHRDECGIVLSPSTTLSRICSRIQHAIAAAQSQPFFLWQDATQSWANEFFYHHSTDTMREKLLRQLPSPCVFR